MSGLSKQVPAIFEGIPRFDQGPPHKKEVKFLKKFAVFPSSLPTLVRPKLLFEIGGSKVKVLLMKKKGDAWKIEKIRVHVFTLELKEKRKEDLNEKISAWLKECFQEFAVGKNYEARLLLKGQEIFLTDIEKPPVITGPKHDLYLWQIAERMPFPGEESRLIFEEKNDTALIAAIHEPALHIRLIPFHENRIHPELVTAMAMAYESLNRQYALFPEKNVLVVHIGSHQTSFFSFQNGEFRSMREIPLGGEAVTQAMMGTLVIDDTQITIGYQEAEALKEKLGLPTPNLMPDAEKEPKLSQLSERIRPIFEKMVTELKSTMIQFQNQDPEQQIQAIYLAGGGGELKGLDEYLSTQLNLSVQKLNVQKIDPQLNLSLAALAGLAYADPKRFNFALREDTWKPKFEAWGVSLKWGSVALAGVVALIAIFIGLQTFTGQSALATQQKKLESLGTVSRALDELHALTQAISERKMTLNQQVKPDLPLGEALKELSHLIPPSIQLTKITFQKEPQSIINLEGIVKTEIHSPDLVLSNLLEQLNQSDLFEHSSLESRNLEENTSAVQFSIRVHLVLKQLIL